MKAPLMTFPGGPEDRKKLESKHIDNLQTLLKNAKERLKVLTDKESILLTERTTLEEKLKRLSDNRPRNPFDMSTIANVVMKRKINQKLEGLYDLGPKMATQILEEQDQIKKLILELESYGAPLRKD